MIVDTIMAKSKVLCSRAWPNMSRSLGLYLRSHSLTLSARVEAFDELNTRLMAPMEFSRSVHSDSVSRVRRLRIHNLVKILYSRIAYDYRHHEAKGGTRTVHGKILAFRI